MQDGENINNTRIHKHKLLQSNYKFIQRSSNFIN